jgi:outer membrane protein assembly factor BamA
VGALTLDWSTSSIESYRDSISGERGYATFLRVRHANALLLSDHEITELFVDVRAFHPVPGLGGHALGLYLSGGVGFGEPLRRSSFSLGGLDDRDITRDLLEQRRSGGGLLRGYPTVALAGDATTLATLEYRVPILEVERGIATLPVFFERIHAAAFTDLGLAFDGVPTPSRYRVGVGAELRANVTLGYYGYFLIRAGYARGVSRDGIDQPYLVLGFPY